MKSKECNGGFQPMGWRGKDGKLYFPTMKGLSVLDPSKLETIHCRRTWLSNGWWSTIEVSLLISRSNSLPARERWNLTSLPSACPRRKEIRFKYMLEGFDKDWVDAGTRRAAYYTNIPAGEYKFRVIASNREGVWSEKGAFTSITLAAPLLSDVYLRFAVFHLWRWRFCGRFPAAHAPIARQ